jgi:hypothetical protein
MIDLAIARHLSISRPDAPLAASAAIFGDPLRGGACLVLEEDSGVMVAITYHAPRRKSVSDVIRVQDWWRLVDAGFEIDEIGAPEPRPLVFIARAATQGRQFVRVVDWRGSLEALAVINPLGDAMRSALLGKAHPSERKRARAAEQEIVKTNGAGTFAAVVASGANTALLSRASPLRWRINSLDELEVLNDFEEMIEPGNPGVPQFLRSIAYDTIERTIAPEAWGATKPQLLKSYSKSLVLPKSETEAVPWQPGIIKPAQHEIRWQDPTGEVAVRLATGTLTLGEAAVLWSTGDALRMLVRRWTEMGLSQRQAVMLGFKQAGYTHREIAQFFEVALSTVKTTVGRANKRIFFPE